MPRLEELKVEFPAFSKLSHEYKCAVISRIVALLNAWNKESSEQTTLKTQYVTTCFRFFDYLYMLAQTNEVEAYEEAAKHCSDIQFNKFKKAIFQTAEFFCGDLRA